MKRARAHALAQLQILNLNQMCNEADLHASRFANLKSLQALHAAAAALEFVCKLRIRIFLDIDRKICNVCNCANLQNLNKVYLSTSTGKQSRVNCHVKWQMWKNYSSSAVQESLQRSLVVVGIWVGEGFY